MLLKKIAPKAGRQLVDPAAGRLLTRTWARGAITTYGYDMAGNLINVSYSDATKWPTNRF